MMTQYLLDTDTCSYILKNKPLSVCNTFKSVGVDNIRLSSITVAELLYGVEKSQSQKINKKVVKEFVSLFQVLPWCEKSSEEYAMIRNDLEKRGEPIGSMDMMIAAHAKSSGLTLVTNNYKHFSKVENLKMVNWVDQ